MISSSKKRRLQEYYTATTAAELIQQHSRMLRSYKGINDIAKQMDYHENKDIIHFFQKEQKEWNRKLNNDIKHIIKHIHKPSVGDMVLSAASSGNEKLLIDNNDTLLDSSVSNVVNNDRGYKDRNNDNNLSICNLLENNKSMQTKIYGINVPFIKKKHNDAIRCKNNIVQPEMKLDVNGHEPSITKSSSKVTSKKYLMDPYYSRSDPTIIERSRKLDNKHKMQYQNFYTLWKQNKINEWKGRSPSNAIAALCIKNYETELYFNKVFIEKIKNHEVRRCRPTCLLHTYILCSNGVFNGYICFPGQCFIEYWMKVLRDALETPEWQKRHFIVDPEDNKKYIRSKCYPIVWGLREIELFPKPLWCKWTKGNGRGGMFYFNDCTFLTDIPPSNVPYYISCHDARNYPPISSTASVKEIREDDKIERSILLGHEHLHLNNNEHINDPNVAINITDSSHKNEAESLNSINHVKAIQKKHRFEALIAKYNQSKPSGFMKYNPFPDPSESYDISMFALYKEVRQGIYYRLRHNWRMDDIINDCEKELKEKNDLDLCRQIIEAIPLFPIPKCHNLFKLIQNIIPDNGLLAKKMYKRINGIKNTHYGGSVLYQEGTKRGNHCGTCQEDFSHKASRTANRCANCNHRANEHHIGCAIIIGNDKSIGICKGCALAKPFLYDIENYNELKQWKHMELINVSTDNAYCTYKGFPPILHDQIFIQRLCINERTATISTSIASKLFDFKSQKEKLFRYKKRSNVRYTTLKNRVNLEYYQALYHYFTPKSNWTYDTAPFQYENAKDLLQFKSDYGEQLNQGFVGFDESIMPRIDGAMNHFESMTTLWDTCLWPGILRKGVHPLQLVLFSHYCSAAFYRTIWRKIDKTQLIPITMMAGMSRYIAYKSRKTCLSGLFGMDRKIQEILLNNYRSNQLTKIWGSIYHKRLMKQLIQLRQKRKSLNKQNRGQRRYWKQIVHVNKKIKVILNKLKKAPKKVLKRISSNIAEFINEHAPEFNALYKKTQYFVEICRWGLACANPSAARFLIKNRIDYGIIDGNDLKQSDCMVYNGGHSVKEHVDTEDVSMHGEENQFDILKLPPPPKLLPIIKSKSSLLCHRAEIGGQDVNCCHVDLHPDDTDYGGHKEIQPLSMYAMVGKGCWGGMMHALHGLTYDPISKQYNGFESIQYTMVLRPAG